MLFVSLQLTFGVGIYAGIYLSQNYQVCLVLTLLGMRTHMRQTQKHLCESDGWMEKKKNKLGLSLPGGIPVSLDRNLPNSEIVLSVLLFRPVRAGRAFFSSQR
jgi:hypothetical protein